VVRLHSSGRTRIVAAPHGRDIWFFSANKAYDQATGVGVPDVANLLPALRALD
jgi:hypothetical protein